MFFCHNTGKAGNNTIKMSHVFHNFAGFECFTDLNLQNIRSMSFKSGKQMLNTILFDGAFFLLAVTVEGDESIAG